MTNLYVYNGQPYYDPISPPTHAPYLDNEGNAWAIPLGQFPSNVETIDVQRNEGDGWVTIAKDIDPTSTYVDHIPKIGQIRYRAISKTSLPSQKIGGQVQIEWVHDRCPIYVNGSAGFTQLCTVRGHQITDNPEIQEVGHHFEGRMRRVAFFNPDAEDYELQFTGNLFDDVSTREEWLSLLRTKDIVCFRDCQGRKIFGTLSLGFTTSGGVTTINLRVSERDHDEGAP